MQLIRRSKDLFACCALAALAVWAVGCAEETVDSPDGNGTIEAPDADPGTDAGGDLDDPAGDQGSTTGAGVDVPDPLPAEGADAAAALPEPAADQEPAAEPAAGETP